MATVLTSLVEAFGPLSRRMPAALRRSLAAAARGVPVPELIGLTIGGVPVASFEFLVPTGVTAQSFDDRLDGVLATPADRLVEELAHSSVDAGVVRRWQQDTDRTMAEYRHAVTRYWRDVVQPHYPRLEQRLRREAERITVGIEEYGAAAVVNTLHPRLTMRDGLLRMRAGYVTGINPWPIDTLIIKPMVAAPMTYMTNIGTADIPQRRVAYFATTPPALRPGWREGPADSLSLLIGRSRAHVLRSLRRRPGTTTDLADEFGLTPGTVSHHLSLLEAAGVVERSRRGGSVYYRVNDRGDRLATL